MTLLAVVLAGLAAATACARPPHSGRLRGRLPATAAPTAPAAPPGPALHDPRARRAAAVGAGAAVALLLGGPVGWGLGAVVAVAGPTALARLQPPPGAADQEAVEAALPAALDLLASCVSGGAPLERALVAVGGATDGPCGTRLLQVAAALALGSPPAEAWDRLAGGEGRAARAAVPGVAATAAAALARAAEGGAPVAASVSRIAAAARASSAAAGRRRARRAGVLAVGPLGLCFLPAFVLLGVVPAVVGLAGPLLSSLE